MDSKVEGLARILADQLDSADDYLMYLSERPSIQGGSATDSEQDELVRWVRDELLQIRTSLNAALAVLKRAS